MVKNNKFGNIMFLEYYALVFGGTICLITVFYKAQFLSKYFGRIYGFLKNRSNEDLDLKKNHILSSD